MAMINNASICKCALARASSMAVVLLALVLDFNIATPASASSPPGNIVTNGDFEQPQIASGADVFFGPAYGTATVPGWSSSGPCIELDNHTGVILPAASGKQSTELDCDATGRGGIYQDLATQAGRNYILRFAFAPRLGSDATQNVLDVSWNGTPVAVLTVDGTASSTWQYYTYTLTASAATTRLAFTDGGIVDGYGTELDDVSVVPSLTTSITVKPAQPNGSNGWYTRPVTLSVGATDPRNSGATVVTQCLLDPPTPPTSFASLAPCPYVAPGAAVGSNGTHTLYAASQDSAGNADPTLVSVTFSVDASAPTASPTAERPPNSAGWYNQPVTVDWLWTDNAGGSGLGTNCPPSTVSSGQGAVTVSATCQDSAGNKGKASDTVQVDTSPPVTTVTVAPGTVLGGTQSVVGTGTISKIDPKSHVATVVKTLPLTCWDTLGLTLDLAATDKVSSVQSLTYAATGAQPIGSTQAGPSVNVFILSGGVSVVTYAARDVADNQEKTGSETAIVGQGHACAASGAVEKLPASGLVTMANGASFSYP
jgi:hypothetical protein